MPEDETIPFRLVGTHEYLNAIELLGQLIKSSDEQEVEVYDRILAKQPEFSFFSGELLSVLNRNALVKSESSRADEGTHRRFHRQTLAWLDALARIEVGATVAMYGDTPNGFEFLAPRDVGRPEYFALLLDDVAVHLRALEQDPLFKKLQDRTSGANSDTLAYLRRMKMVGEMLLAAGRAEGNQFADSAEDYLREIRKASRKLAAKTELAAADTVYSNVRESSEDLSVTEFEAGTVRSLSPITRACQAQIPAST